MNTNNKTIRLKESDLRKIISKTLKQVLSEGKFINNKSQHQWITEFNPSMKEINAAWKKQQKRKDNEYDTNFSIVQQKRNFIHQYGQYLTPNERKGKFTNETWKKIENWQNYGTPDEQDYDYRAEQDLDDYMYGREDTFDADWRPQGTLGTVHPDDLKNY